MKAKEKIVLVGGGGHCTSVIDVIENQGHFEIAGIVERKDFQGQSVLGYKVIADDGSLDKLVVEYKNFIISIGHIKSNATRVKLFNLIKKLGGFFPTIVSHKSYVSKHAVIEEGTIVMHHALVNANAHIGKNSIINTGSVVEHDSIIGDHCHLATGAYINGECQIGSNVFVGSRSVLFQGCRVGAGSLIGAGSVVIDHVEANSLVVGAPAILKKTIR
jgi:sugar O-acyltransferase (sialic acid O-acetyltransferase NeuD family)